MGQRRNAGEVEELVEGFRNSGLERGEYCRRVGVAVHILSYYLRRQVGDQGLVRVNLVAEAGEASPGAEHSQLSGTRLILVHKQPQCLTHHFAGGCVAARAHLRLNEGFQFRSEGDVHLFQSSRDNELCQVMILK